MSGVKVAVRVRPFNQREKDLNAVCCVAMDGPVTMITDLDGEKKEEKKFTFDYSYWSHDKFTDVDGYSTKVPGSNYADQQQVFNQLGMEVLNNAWEGYHVCLFAYGQTGAGKSYSMVGYGKNKGIVPITCEEIFNRIARNDDPTRSFEVQVGMLEIYNECVQDLLSSNRPKGGLDIRESKQLGIYVDGLMKTPVSSYAEIERVTDEGTSNRTVGATLMNATSSRAHTVITIEFTQVTEFAGKQGRKLAVINLVDLAGSEKAGQTGASGDRLKEGCAINKSLSSLGNVISALADKAGGKFKGVIPYRDSKLTRLLQNALGGSSKTIMICAVSPASSNYEESLSTLRYADRAKKIKNNAQVNEDPTERIIRELKEENAKLKALLEGKGISGSTGDAGLSDEEKQKIREEHEQEIAAMEKALADMQKSWQQKLDEAKTNAPAISTVAAVDWASIPHLTVLNEDSLLSAKLSFAIPQSPEELSMGKRTADYQPSVCLSGSGVLVHHCTIESRAVEGSTDPEVFLNIVEGGGLTFVNGVKLEADQEMQIRNGDRLVLGNTYAFLVILPQEGKETRDELLGMHTWQDVMKELQSVQGDFMKPAKTAEEVEEERRKKAEYAQKVKDTEEAMEQQKLEYESRMKEMAEDQRKKFEEEYRLAQDQFAKQKREIEDKERERVRAEADAAELETKLMQILPLIKEGNLISQELGFDFTLKPKFKVAMSKRGKKTELVVSILRQGTEAYCWHTDVLENRIYLMRDLLDSWAEADDKMAFIKGIDDDANPFWDPVAVERVLGTGQLLLESLSMQLENAMKIKLFDEEGRPSGTLDVGVYPVNDQCEDLADEDIKESPEELVGSTMHYMVKIVSSTLTNAPSKGSIFVRFRVYLEDSCVSTMHVKASTIPNFNFQKLFTQEPVTQSFLEYVQSDALVFEVMASDEEVQEPKTEPAPKVEVVADVPSPTETPKALANPPSAPQEIEAPISAVAVKEERRPSYSYNGYDKNDELCAKHNIIPPNADAHKSLNDKLAVDAALKPNDATHAHTATQEENKPKGEEVKTLTPRPDAAKQIDTEKSEKKDEKDKKPKDSKDKDSKDKDSKDKDSKDKDPKGKDSKDKDSKDKDSKDKDSKDKDSKDKDAKDKAKQKDKDGKSKEHKHEGKPKKEKDEKKPEEPQTPKQEKAKEIPALPPVVKVAEDPKPTEMSPKKAEPEKPKVKAGANACCTIM